MNASCMRELQLRIELFHKGSWTFSTDFKKPLKMAWPEVEKHRLFIKYFLSWLRGIHPIKLFSFNLKRVQDRVWNALIFLRVQGRRSQIRGYKTTNLTSNLRNLQVFKPLSSNELIFFPKKRNSGFENYQFVLETLYKYEKKANVVTNCDKVNTIWQLYDFSFVSVNRPNHMFWDIKNLLGTSLTKSIKNLSLKKTEKLKLAKC